MLIKETHDENLLCHLTESELRERGEEGARLRGEFEHIDVGRAYIVRTDTGELLRQRALTDEERQQSLFGSGEVSQIELTRETSRSRRRRAQREAEESEIPPTPDDAPESTDG